ncbi:MAG: hypothetical protein CMJ19_24890 [Phycisphaeraceae bacterium]|nr:hypothetical protein [Phycisphaeraceae bacterium]
MKCTPFVLLLCLGICACTCPVSNASKSSPAPSIPVQAQPQETDKNGTGEQHAHDHEQDHSHDHASEPEKPKVVYSAEQLIDMVKDARTQRNAKLIEQITAFDQTVLAKRQIESDNTRHPAYDQLHEQLQQNITFLKSDRYISRLAGTSEDFDIPLLAEAQKQYVETTDATIDAYAKALAEAIRNDPEGHIGTWVKSDLKNCIDVELMCQLNEFYWHHGHLDNPPGSFDSIINISYRVLELEPDTASIYADTAWLLWSRWVTWKQEPEKMPIGENDDKTAIALLLRGRKACPDNASYHFDAAMTVWGLARHHKPEYWGFILDSLKLARKTVKPDNQWLNVRIRTTLGHVYRQLEQFDDARKAYQSVLEVDPENDIAKRLLKEMDEAANTNNGQEI